MAKRKRVRWFVAVDHKGESSLKFVHEAEDFVADYDWLNEAGISRQFRVYELVPVTLETVKRLAKKEASKHGKV